MAGHNPNGAVVDRAMDYRILGSFEVWVGDRLVGLGGEKPRALLAILLLHRNEVVSADRLIDELWGESPPETALRTAAGVCLEAPQSPWCPTARLRPAEPDSATGRKRWRAAHAGSRIRA